MDIRASEKPMGWHLPEYCAFGGAISVAMQVAVTLGYTELYLLGMDLGFGRPENHHFDPQYSKFDPLGHAPWRDQTLEYIHQFINRDMSKLGFTVMNATVGGTLEVYPRTTVQDVLNETIVVPEEVTDGT